MNKKTEYYVAFHWHLGDLMKEVNDLIKKGWIVQGGVSISVHGSHHGYAQALLYVKEEKGETE